MHVQKANLNLSTHDMIRPVCLAVGGRYDNLLNKYWAPTAVIFQLGLPTTLNLFCFDIVVDTSVVLQTDCIRSKY